MAGRQAVKQEGTGGLAGEKRKKKPGARAARAAPPGAGELSRRGRPPPLPLPLPKTDAHSSPFIFACANAGAADEAGEAGEAGEAVYLMGEVRGDG